MLEREKNTVINLTDSNITFPKNGFFVAIEWLIIGKSKYDPKSTDSRSQND